MEKLFTLEDVRCIEMPQYADPNGYLNVYDKDNGLPFEVKRVFTVSTENSAKRGFHAHRFCQQFLVCLEGLCMVRCDDGIDSKCFILENRTYGLYIPSSIWAEQSYECSSTLLVLCDLAFDEADYIRDYEDYKLYRSIKKNKCN